MVAPYVTSFERLVSKPRLDKNRPSNRDDLETMIKYLWNISLSEALLQGLSALEVGLRNAVHNTFTAQVGTEYWFQAILLPEEMKVVNDAWAKLSKRHNQPPSPGKIIAELTFGFWPYLFDARYHDLLVEQRHRAVSSDFSPYPDRPPAPSGHRPQDCPRAH